MKCPKCGYIGYERTAKCRLCGYDFSLLANPVVDLDLPLKCDEPLEAPADFDLQADRTEQPARRPQRMADKDDVQVPSLAPGDMDAELPLFAPADAAPLDDDSRPAAGRARSAAERSPAAVTPSAVAGSPARRPASAPPPARPASPPPRVRTAPTFQPRPARGSLASLKDAELDLVPETPAPRTPTPRSITGRPGGPVARAIAALLDLSILLGLDAAVLYFTLRVCRLSFSDVAILPIAPLVAFFLLLDGAYLVAFTAAGGQTIGKMAASLKVVGADGTSVLPGQAAMRAVGYVASVLPAGLGFVPGFFGPSRRALHDRLANTWVVRV
jgi:uncharacterized RDD family membrane protein YckC